MDTQSAVHSSNNSPQISLRSNSTSSMKHDSIRSNSSMNVAKHITIMKPDDQSINLQDLYNTFDVMGNNSNSYHYGKMIQIAQIRSRDSNQINEQKEKQERVTIFKLLSSKSSKDIFDAKTQQERSLKENGYMAINKYKNSLQGEIIEAQSLDKSKNVIIKRADKLLYNKRISIQSGVNIVVEEDIVKEALILHHLTVDNKPLADSVPNFIDFFESKDSYYVVMEKAGNMTLCEFTKRAHQFIADKRLKIKEWKKVMKYIFWQLTVFMYWMHHDMNCCHLDFNSKNIMIENGNFILNEEDNTVNIDTNFKIKVIDFGLSEIFKTSDIENKSEKQLEESDDEYAGNPFKCQKHGITELMHLAAPKVYAGETYDAKKADIWSLGIILYELATGLEPYKTPNITDNEFYKVKHGNIMELIATHNKSKYVNQKMINLMGKMLTYRENKRVDCSQILMDEWLCLYYNKQKLQIQKKSEFQILKNKNIVKKMKVFPFYKC